MSDELPPANEPQSDGASEAVLDEATLLETLKQVVDPELFINIVDLGLVYTVNHDDEGKVFVEMTLTSPACPAGPQIIQQAKAALERLDGVSEAAITLVMSPPWSPGANDRRSPRSAGDFLSTAGFYPSAECRRLIAPNHRLNCIPLAAAPASSVRKNSLPG